MKNTKLASKAFMVAREVSPEKIAEQKIIERIKNTLQSDERRSYDTSASRALQSISYLLDWGSQGGNKHLDGQASYGLSRLVEECIAEIRRDKGRRDFVLENLSRL